MEILIYFAVFVIAFCGWFHYTNRRRNELLSKIPALNSYPVVGSILSLAGKSATEIFATFEKASSELGSVFRVDVSPFLSNIFIADPAIAEAILSSRTLIEKSVEYDLIRNWLNNGRERRKF